MLARYDTSPYRFLTAAFAAWKTLLLAVALGSCVGPSYDTSGSLLLSDGAAGPGNETTVATVNGVMSLLATRLTSWDAIYFVQAARRGYLFEQEWAFGPGLPNVVHAGVKALETAGLVDSRDGSLAVEALVGVAVSHAAHLASVLLLYRLGRLLWHDRRTALLAAVLHVLCPAGLFLSAPYAESAFSCLSFAGSLLFAEGSDPGRQALSRDARLVLAGCAFGLATAFRTNGLLNGIPFAWAALQAATGLVERGFSVASCRRLVALGLGGLCVAGGSVAPQFWAWQTYCSGASRVDGVRRPWCEKAVPSIYTFVQERYWDNGFLRYWTISNIPLFLLGAPMLSILAKSGVDALQKVRAPSGPPHPLAIRGGPETVSFVQSLAAAQVLLAVMALTSHHVQIITRLSSGYAVWYWWLAGSLLEPDKSGRASKLVVFVVMYGAIQAALFASFLPPA